MAEKPKSTSSEEQITNIEDVKSEIQKIIDQAKAEAEKILAQSKEEAAKIVTSAKQTSEKQPAPIDEELAKHQAYMNEYVEVKLFKDNSKYKDDVFVAVNGESCLIQRGKTVKIKRKFAEALKNSAVQDEYLAEYLEKLSGNYKEKEDKLS